MDRWVGGGLVPLAGPRRSLKEDRLVKGQLEESNSLGRWGRSNEGVGSGGGVLQHTFWNNHLEAGEQVEVENSAGSYMGRI